MPLDRAAAQGPFRRGHGVAGRGVLPDAPALDVAELRHARSLAAVKIGRRMTESIDIAVIGAGQAGLATSWYLSQAGADHVVFDSGRIAETWRSRRWDSFCLVTPNQAVKLPGPASPGPDPDRFLSLPELVAVFVTWRDFFPPALRGMVH